MQKVWIAIAIVVAKELAQLLIEHIREEHDDEQHEEPE